MRPSHLDELSIDVERLTGELDQLATYSDTPAPSVTRVLFTPRDVEGRAYVKALMRDAGLSVREDAAGNIFGRWQGRADGAVGTGSHCDAIPHAGKYDGTVGVLGGIAAVRSLKAAGFSPRRSIDVIMFTSEEPTRFGIGCVGSRLLGGAIAAAGVDALTDADGISFATARSQAGYEGDLAAVELTEQHYDFFVELHIEQGPELERQGKDIGVVSAIAAPASLRVSFEGDGGHAGTVLMGTRQDALVPLARLIALAEDLARTSENPDTVATTGIVEVHPGAINSIPRRATATFDIRGTDLTARQRVVDGVLDEARRLADARGLGLEVETINADPPAETHPAIVDAVVAACEDERFGHTSLVSRAYHDALFMARKVPMGMIFVPSKDGISHRPDEFTTPDEIRRGVAVLARTLAGLADGA